MSPAAEATPTRRYERRALRLPLTLLLPRGEVIEGLTKDLGMGGVGAAIPEAVSLGERVILKILDEPTKAELLLLAAVRHRDGFLHGLEFTALSSKQRELIQQWCSKQNGRADC
ncbi:MAG TPA: PilZ domain-containing protein [Terriglobales bacterium]|nr:PilZ domain-containing protein [Terriglobales bacterium]